MFRGLCGDTTLKNVVLVTNMWGEVSSEEGQDRENQLSTNFFKPVLDLGAQMARHDRTVKSAHDIIRGIMKNHPEALQIQRELVDEQKGIVDTAAGEAVNQELNDEIKRCQDELKKAQEAMEEAMKKKDEEMRQETMQEFEEERKKTQEEMDEIVRAGEDMASRYAEQKEKMEARMKQIEQQKEVLRGLVTVPIYE